MKKYLCLVLVMVVAACQKDVTPEDDPETKKECLLTKMIQGKHSGSVTDTVFTFHYNDTGRLEKVSLQTYDDGSIYDFYMYYDNEGRLIRIGPDLETKFTYNQRGLLSEVEFSVFDSVRITFEYDGADDLPTGSKKYDYYNGQWSTQFEKKYHFENGNMVRQEWLENGVVTKTDVYEYYDSIPNLKAVCLLSINYASIPLGLWEEFLYFNKNMLKRSGDLETYWDIKTDSGRISHARTTMSSSPGWEENRFYFYDCK